MPGTDSEPRANIADVICIGAQKAGTSWLHYTLQAHPSLYAFPNRSPLTSTNKEAHFWDWNRARGVDWYRDLLRPPDRDRLSMDFTPEYALMRDEEIAECKALNPTASIIYLVRDPVERALSALTMHRRASGSRARIALDDALHRDLARFRVLEHCDYAGNFARWSLHYSDRVLVLGYRDIVLDPAKARDRVIAFLRLPPSPADGAAARSYARRTWSRVWVGERVQAGPEVRAFLEESLAGARHAAESRFGLDLRASARDHFIAAARRLIRLPRRRR